MRNRLTCNGFQLREQPVQLMIFRHQRIAAGKMISSGSGVRRYTPARLSSCAYCLILRIWEVTTETVAAIYHIRLLPAIAPGFEVFMQ